MTIVEWVFLDYLTNYSWQLHGSFRAIACNFVTVQVSSECHGSVTRLRKPRIHKLHATVANVQSTCMQFHASTRKARMNRMHMRELRALAKDFQSTCVQLHALACKLTATRLEARVQVGSVPFPRDKRIPQCLWTAYFSRRPMGSILTAAISVFFLFSIFPMNGRFWWLAHGDHHSDRPDKEPQPQGTAS